MLAKLTLFTTVLCLGVNSCTAGRFIPVEQLCNNIPEELVGVWATEGTVLNEGHLIKGEVLYLTAHGTGAVMGSGPPPLGGVILASYDVRSSTMNVLLLGCGHSKWKQVRVVYDTKKQTMVQEDPDATYHRISGSIPKDLIRDIGPERWEEELSRLRSLIRDMDLYFPRLGYAQITRIEQIIDSGNHFREEAWDFLRSVDEPKLSSFGGREIEIYRLIWIGASFRPSPFVVRVQRNRDGLVKLAATVDDKVIGEPMTRRRGLMSEDWATLKKRIEAAMYFDLPIRIGEKKLDRGWWIIEGLREGKYHYVEGYSPGPGPYWELCEYIVELGGFDPKLYEGK